MRGLFRAVNVVVSLVVGVIMCLIATTIAHAQSRADSEWAANELSSEMMECGQYFLITSLCIKNFPNPEAGATANDYRAMSDEILTLAATRRSAKPFRTIWINAFKSWCNAQ
jgi:hypothetical protein